MKKLEDGFKLSEPDEYTTITSLGKVKDLDPLGKATNFYLNIIEGFANPEDEIITVNSYFGPLAASCDLYLKDKDGKFTYGVMLWIS